MTPEVPQDLTGPPMTELQKGAPQIDSRDPKVQPKVIQPHKVS